jgi:hypothetical protein
MLLLIVFILDIEDKYHNLEPLPFLPDAELGSFLIKFLSIQHFI